MAMQCCAAHKLTNMTIKLNKNNSNFQTAYFIAGAYHTPDAAYIALLNQRQDREMVLNSVPVAELKKQAAIIRAKRKIASDDEAEQLEGQSELLEIESTEDFNKQLVNAAREELDFINQCIEKLQPYRKYSHMSDAEAAEACQAEEWGLELCYRAENYMLTQGTIPHDHFSTMRRHPMFEQMILPRIEQLHIGLQTPGGMTELLTNTPAYDLPKMLGFEKGNNNELPNTTGN